MQFILELEPDSEPTNGCLRDAEGRSFEFVGWLGFPTTLGQALMETAGRRPRLMTGRLTARIARASGATTDEAPPIEFSRLGRESRLPRVPAVFAWPYAKPHAVTDIVHDHTSVLATIEAKWNLPALTYRDAATVMDFLDPSHPAFATPPVIQGPRSPDHRGPRPAPRPVRLTATARPPTR